MTIVWAPSSSRPSRPSRSPLSIRFRSWRAGGRSGAGRPSGAGW